MNKKEVKQVEKVTLPIIEVVEKIDRISRAELEARAKAAHESQDMEMMESDDLLTNYDELILKLERGAHANEEEVSGVTFGMVRNLREYVYRLVSDEDLAKTMEALRLLREKRESAQ